ncbi:glycoside hydrolase family 43 protein [Enterococcus casseliflavus]|uniref:glycoside hydrolase family 43 protein n=1 Tax=Enterococcus casseliflavus TaxID=37734 RepID=UPI00115EDF54|nr:glycoside hydrolase family 43 protein [Enterococcus casseliflavus]MCD4960592.1 glycoside hydrolase family 43 protein [Enterococcus casseliflavus]MDT2978538.1 glycoside hydrolase family 43 protein [Enterococcus casseliflavus]MDY2549219.1 glycoside hydrolase family 43 protein [Enterococcus casseliflavus]MEB6211350.1 glycoside hydrolase family 43 protein [Enterococcus casseliflavus]MUN75364.1 family 43 glycosylhydrolase [Enterococcus casseliflavus]
MAKANAETIQNPIVYERADPWVYLHSDGYYYFTGSVPGYQSIELRRAKSLNELEDAERKTVWQAHESGPMSELIWAPEIHFIADKWYIYFAASDNEEIRNENHHHRMFVIENNASDPFEGEWEEKGQVITQFESFSLDATVFEHQEKLYYVWAQQDPRIPGNSNLYLSEMENPWTLKGKQLLLSIPEYPWEQIGFMVNEGPAVLKRNGKIFITYSGSATDENYAMGLLWIDENSDLLNGFSWHKSQEPVFQTSERNSQYGPGHNSFTKGADGEDILVYHARPEKNQAGDPLANPNRHAVAQPFTWDEKGFPVFGEPVANNKLEMKVN